MLDDVVAGAEVVLGVGEELLAIEASGVSTLANTGSLVVGLTAQSASWNDEAASGNVVSQTARVNRVGGARASVGVPGGSTEAVDDRCTLAFARSSVVDLAARARRNVE